MNSISFKKFRLFKTSARPAPPNGTARNGQNFEKPRSILLNPLFWLALFVLVMSYLLSQLPPKSLPAPAVGEIAQRDIAAPADLTIVDMETTQSKRREAAESVPPIYALDPSVFSNTQGKIHQFFQLGRETSRRAAGSDIGSLQKIVGEKFDVEIPLTDLAYLLQSDFPPFLEEPLINILGKILGQGVLVSKDLFIHREQELGFVVFLPGEQERSVKAADFLDLQGASRRVAAEVEPLGLTSRRKSLLVRLGQTFLQPNVTLETVETAARRSQAAARVEPIFYQIKKDKVIIRQGDEVTHDALRQIRLINSNLRTVPSWLLNVLGTFILLTLLFTSMWYYLRSLEKLPEAGRIFFLLGLLLILGLLLDRLFLLLGQTISAGASWSVLAHREAYAYAIPLQFGALLFAFLTTIPVALIFVILNSLAAGYLFQADFFLFLFCFIGGLAAIYGVKYFQRQKRTTILRAGLFLVTPLNLLLILAIQLVKERGGEMALFLSESFMAVIGGVLGSALAFVLLPMIETLLGFLTPPRLAEITSSDIPILRQMALEAPGTYHHSLIVATLAEKAAEDAKLDPQLVKAGALYHDIGKLKRPEYFYENRSRKVDAHHGLTPSMSRLLIISHVKDGLETARSLRLPQRVREIIEQHHGTNLVRYFYQKAKEKYDPEMQTVGEEHFRYPGPSPRSKEAALVMLADAVEAASRSLRQPTSDHLKRVIQDLFDGFIHEGELDESGLSLKDLQTIGLSFLMTLESMHHPRVSYPGSDYESEPRQGQAAKPRNKDDHRPQPAAPAQDPDDKV